jgi:hypothetical protein
LGRAFPNSGRSVLGPIVRMSGTPAHGESEPTRQGGGAMGARCPMAMGLTLFLVPPGGPGTWNGVSPRLVMRVLPVQTAARCRMRRSPLQRRQCRARGSGIRRHPSHEQRNLESSRAPYQVGRRDAAAAPSEEAPARAWSAGPRRRPSCPPWSKPAWRSDTYENSLEVLLSVHKEQSGGAGLASASCIQPAAPTRRAAETLRVRRPPPRHGAAVPTGFGGAPRQRAVGGRTGRTGRRWKPTSSELAEREKSARTWPSAS